MSELQQKRKRPWYTEDILYIIAEKLLARIPDGPRQARLEIDFCRQNPYTLFMGHNEMATRTIISQFAKFKRIVFYKQIKFRGDGEDKIEFYKNERIDYYSPTAEEFRGRGPYIVPKGMLEFLIENGKLRVDNIETCLFFPNDHSIDIKEFGEMNSLKAFCALFLGKQIQIPDGLNNNLMVKKFRVDDESIKSIQNNLETILAIDAVELEFHCNGHFIIDCSQYKSSIIAQNTTKIKVDQFHWKFFSMKLNKFATNFETFCSFLIRVCPNLNNLQFKIHEYSIDYSYSSIAEFTRNFYSIIKTMEAGIKSINIGNEHLQISIELIARFSQFHYQYDKLPIQSHDLFKLGTPFTIKNAQFRYIARSLECVDACGRIHKLLFKFVEDRRYR